MKATEIQYEIAPGDVKAQVFKLMLPVRLRIGLAAIAAMGVALLVLGSSAWVGWALLLFPLVFILFYYRVITRMLVEHPELLERQTLTFDEESLRIANSSSQITWPWGRVKSIAESGQFLVFRFDSLGSGAVIPKTALSSEQIKELKKLSNAAP